MNEMQSEHATRVVDSFKSILTDDARAHVSAEQFGELALLIEAAIDASLVDQLNRASSIARQATADIQKLAKQV